MNLQFINHTGNTLKQDLSALGIITIDYHFAGSAFALMDGKLIVTSYHIFKKNDRNIRFVTTANATGQNIKMFRLDFIERLPKYDLVLLRSLDGDVCKEPLPMTSQPISASMLSVPIYYYGYDQKIDEHQQMNPNVSFISKNGNPKGIPDEGRHAYSSKVDSIGFNGQEKLPVTFIEYLGYGVPGFSGGAVLNANGEVVALNTYAWRGQELTKKEGPFVALRANSIKPLEPLIKSLI